MSSRSSNNPHPKISFPGFYCVGYVKSAHGIRGELFIRLFAERADWLDDVKDLAFLKPGEANLQIQKPTALRVHKEGLITSVEGIVDRNQSELLKGSQVYIREELLQAAAGDSIYLHQILGFTLVDKEFLVLGIIQGFGSNGPQDLLKVLTHGTQVEALVPYVPAFLVDIDFDKKQVRMDLPPGLLTLEDK